MRHRLPAIARHEARVAKVRAAAVEAVHKLQRACKHEQVIETPFRSGEFFGPFYARRICAACGVEESCRYSWPGTTIDAGFYEFARKPDLRTILNSEFAKNDDVTKYRVKL